MLRSSVDWETNARRGQRSRLLGSQNQDRTLLWPVQQVSLQAIVTSLCHPETPSAFSPSDTPLASPRTTAHCIIASVLRTQHQAYPPPQRILPHAPSSGEILPTSKTKNGWTSLRPRPSSPPLILNPHVRTRPVIRKVPILLQRNVHPSIPHKSEYIISIPVNPRYHDPFAIPDHHPCKSTIP